MKKSFFYITTLAMGAFGLFAAFSDPAPAADANANMTDEQKIDAAFQAKVTAFKAEKAAACESECLAEANNQFGTLKAEAEALAAANTKPGTKTKKPTKPSTGNQTTTTTTTTTTTNTKTDPKDSKMSGGSTTDQKDSKMSGGGTTDKKDSKMKGGN